MTIPGSTIVMAVAFVGFISAGCSTGTTNETTWEIMHYRIPPPDWHRGATFLHHAGKSYELLNGGLYRNDSLVEFLRNRSEGVERIAREELDRDRLLRQSLDIDLVRTVRLHGNSLNDNGKELRVTRHGDTCFHQDDSLLTVYTARE